MGQVFDRNGLVDAFRDLGRRASKVIELSECGGSVLMLTYDWLAFTRDVDAAFEADKAFMRRLAADIAAERGWEVRRPFFAGELESLKALLTVQSPAAFRRRLLFVSSDALDRPRRQTAAGSAADT